MALLDNQIRELAKKYHTPLYIFEESIIRRQCRDIKSALCYPHTVVRYACKALTIGAVLQIVRSEGLALDAVSLNEVRRGLLAGFSPEQILYTGEGASELVFKELLELGVLINCSSIDQLRLIGRIQTGARCSVRFNPGQGHGANDKVNTGGPSSKHGVYFDQISQVKEVLSANNLRLVGVHSHIGSGTDLDHWLRIKDLTFNIAAQFSGLEFVDLGGGFPIVYDSSVDKPMPLKEWGAELSKSMFEFSKQYGSELKLYLEPGRFIVAESGFLLAEVQTIKSTPDYNFVIVNTGLNHNIRPALYGAYHQIDFISGDARKMNGSKPYVVAGYICESGDVFTVAEQGKLKPRLFPELQLGDLMLMRNVGAYSHSMKSEYNSMNLPASVLIEESGKVRLIERRGTLSDIMRREVEVY